MNKVIRDGKVAVLYSPDYGAGWYSWNEKYPECLYHPDIVALVESGNLKEAKLKAEEIWPDGYWGGARDLEIEWMAQGAQFRIKEYDGLERIEYNYDVEWEVA